MIPVLSIIVSIVVMLLTIPAWTKERSMRDADLFAIILFVIDASFFLVLIHSVGALL